MKSPWLTVGVAISVAALSIGQGRSEEPAKASPPAADPMLGKAHGDVRDDNALKMKLVWCPPGKFTMGSPKTEPTRNKKNEYQVDVTLTNGYWLGVYEVTQS